MKRTPYTGASIITADKAEELIKANGSRWFWTAFIRKTDKKGRDQNGDRILIAKAGDIRYMCARTGVTKGRKTPNGEGRKYNFSEKRLISVWDRQAKDYRAVSKDHMVYLKCGGRKYVVLTDATTKFCKENPTHEMSKAVKANKVVV